MPEEVNLVRAGNVPARTDPQAAAQQLDGSIRAANAKLARELAEIDKMPASVGGLKGKLRQQVVTSWVLSVGGSSSTSTAGYAAALAASKPGGAEPSAKSTKGSGSQASKSGGEWDFLHDPKVSIEDKLFRFMALTQKKNDEELTRKMEEYRGKYTKEGQKKGDGGGIFGFMGDIFGGIAGAIGGLVNGIKAVFPPLALAEKMLGATGLQKLIAQIPGPLLAGLCTVVGAPQLAPLALKVGGAIGDEIKGSGSAKKSDDTEGKEAGTPDEKLAMLELQRMVEKQNQTFNLISNILKNMHDTSMNTINNLK